MTDPFAYILSELPISRESAHVCVYMQERAHEKILYLQALLLHVAILDST